MKESYRAAIFIAISLTMAIPAFLLESPVQAGASLSAGVLMNKIGTYCRVKPLSREECRYYLMQARNMVQLCLLQYGDTYSDPLQRNVTNCIDNIPRKLGLPIRMQSHFMPLKGFPVAVRPVP